MKRLFELASRRRFGMKPGLETIRRLCEALGNPQRRFKSVHVAGTNGKGAVCAFLDAALPGSGRYTSPHLVRLNERFFLSGQPVSDALLEATAEKVSLVLSKQRSLAEVTFFEALTAIAFELFASQDVSRVILETGLGGRLDATNICVPELCVITRIGLDHCDWLGDTVEKIAQEKAGIVKPGVPVVLARNVAAVRAVVSARAQAVGAPFYYAPDCVDLNAVPDDMALSGPFNRENAQTALAALKILENGRHFANASEAFRHVVWPGRFQRVGRFIVDGAHNPPAAEALARALQKEAPVDLIAGFCGDKDVDCVLRTLASLVRRAFAVRTNNPRSLSAERTAEQMRQAGLVARPCGSLREAVAATEPHPTVICGSLFLAGEALVELGAYPWGEVRFDAAELLKI